MMHKKLINDIIEWDIVNWSQAITFWESKVNFDKTFKCLELGGRSGGLSLWLANKGLSVICSDLENPKSNASKLHTNYGLTNISYESINALNISYESEFDIIVFKSILGGVSRGNKNERKKIAIKEIPKALKPEGKLLFAENLVASPIHQFFRKKFVKWGSEWNYLHISEIEELFSMFKKFDYTSVGFLGAFGRNEKQRNILEKIDNLIAPLIGKNHRYILIGIAEK